MLCARGRDFFFSLLRAGAVLSTEAGGNLAVYGLHFVLLGLGMISKPQTAKLFLDLNTRPLDVPKPDSDVQVFGLRFCSTKELSGDSSARSCFVWHLGLAYIYIYAYIHICICIYIYISSKGKTCIPNQGVTQPSECTCISRKQ